MLVFNITASDGIVSFGHVVQMYFFTATQTSPSVGGKRESFPGSRDVWEPRCRSKYKVHQNVPF